VNSITVFLMNYNGGKEAVKAAVNAVMNQTIKHDTIFLDNDSTDGSFGFASGYSLKNNLGIRFIRNGKNRHVCYLQQQAMDMCKTKYAAFCHIDCVPEKAWLRKLYRVAEKENAGAVEPRIVHDGGVTIHGGITRWFTPTLVPEGRYPSSVSTCTTLYRNLGLKMFPASYLHYHDETYASEVIKRAGYKLVHMDGCIVNHGHGSAAGLTGLKWKALARFNQMRLVLKFHRPCPNPPECFNPASLCPCRYEELRKNEL